MRRSMLVLALVVVSLISATAGTLLPRDAQATNAFELWINPGGSTNALTCGWHSTCLSPYPYGNALDWGNTGGTSVYFRGFADWSGGGTTGIGWGYPRRADGTCYVTSIDIYSSSWTFRGTAAYMHTNMASGLSSFSITAGSLGSPIETVSGPIGTTVSSELTANCPWEGAHLHQYSTASGWYANTGVYPSAPSTGTGYGLNDVNYWQNRTYWSE